MLPPSGVKLVRQALFHSKRGVWWSERFSFLHTRGMDMSALFGATWGTLIERCEDLPEDATLITPLSTRRFRVTEVQQQRVIVEDTATGDSQPSSARSSKLSSSILGIQLVTDTSSGESYTRCPCTACGKKEVGHLVHSGNPLSIDLFV